MKNYIAVAALLAAGTAFSNAATLVTDLDMSKTQLNAVYDTSAATYETEGGATATTGTWANITGSAWGGSSEGYSTTGLAVAFWMKSDYDENKLASSATNQDHPEWCSQWVWESCDPAQANALSFGVAADGSLRLNLETKLGINTDAEIVNAGTWMHVGFLYVAGNLAIYVNGKQVATGTVDASNTIAYNNGQNLRLAEKNKNMSEGFSTWTGGIDELNVWNIESVNDGAKAISDAYASAIPEPSAFGLLAGLGALALVASRRRRK